MSDDDDDERDGIGADEVMTSLVSDKVVSQVTRNVATVGARARRATYRGTCTERMRRAGKAVDPVPCAREEARPSGPPLNGR